MAFNTLIRGLYASFNAAKMPSLKAGKKSIQNLRTLALKNGELALQSSKQQY